MITEWIIQVFQSVVQWGISLFGTTEPPAWLDGVAAWLGDMFARSSGLGAWFPFVLFGSVAGSYFGLWLVLWIVKLIRWGYGLTPFSGGS